VNYAAVNYDGSELPANPFWHFWFVREVDTGLESSLKIYKDLKISENSSKVHELF
jgi:galactose mutarotase-like enzyme